MPAVEQARLVREGEVSSLELVELYLERIARLDPELNSFVTVCAEEALARARDIAGPVVICVRTDRDANLGVAADPTMRFAEVYQGPM